MSNVDMLDDLEALVRERLRLATQDKVLFERDGQRLNSQLMQGEINMGMAVLGWIALRRQGIALADVEDDADDHDPDV
jgi:hypothetical protein